MPAKRKATLMLGIAAVVVLAAIAAMWRTNSNPPQRQAQRVLVLKREHRLLLLDRGGLIKAYKISIGRGGLGPKQREGDHKTPEALYKIDRRKRDSRFHRALHVSYPNEADLQHAQSLGVAPGGDIMIHGIMNGMGWLGRLQRLADWTDGCIAATDSEIEEIWSAVPDGTPIEIRQ